MKRLLPFYLLLLFVTAHSQEQITLKFVRPSSTQGPTEKIQLTIQNNEYIIKNGGEISLNVTPDYSASLKIDCSISTELQTNYFLDPKPAQTYVFEVGLRKDGIYIKLVSGEEADLGVQVQWTDTQVQKTETEENKEVPVTKVKAFRTLKEISLGIQKSLENKTPREKFLIKSGKVQYLSLMLTGIYTQVDMGKFGPMNGAGGGYSLGRNFINLKMPEFSSGSTKWNSFNWGFNLDFNMYMVQFNTVFKSGGLTTTNAYSVGNLNIMVAPNLGWTWGFGKYTDENNWKGIALTLKYRPMFTRSFIFTNITTSTSNSLIKETEEKTDATKNSFNAVGIGFDIDFTKYSTAGLKISPKPRAKISINFLPPIGDNPMFLSLSYGLAIYYKKIPPRY
ncbi:MAG: hypothetical protein AB9846_04405 [Tenuifilaceae bacterium]